MSNRLLYSMSSREHISIEQFNAMFSAVCEQHRVVSMDNEGDNPRRQAVRLLDSLGHCEFDFDSRQVWVCPPLLALLPSCGLPKAILTGARSPVLIKKLKQAVAKRKDTAAISNVPQETAGIQLPSIITIEAMDTETIRTIANESGIAASIDIPASWRMVNFSSGLEEIKAISIFTERADINWASRVFVPERLTFVPKIARDSSKLQFFAYRNSVDQQIIHRLWNGTQAAEIDRDWGRYWILSDFEVNVLLYDSRHYRLAVPATVPLPCLLARALVLCTGKIPLTALTCQAHIGAIPPKHPMQIYEGVTPAISDCISKKVGQKLILANLKTDENGAINA